MEQKYYKVTAVEEIVDIFNVIATNKREAEQIALSNPELDMKSQSNGYVLVKVEEIKWKPLT